MPERGPIGWRFKGSPSAEQKEIAQERISSDPRINEIYSLIECSNPGIAFNLVMEIVRDAWTAAGVDLSIVDGKGRASRGLRMPVAGWFNDTVRDALKQWHALRRRKHKSDMQRRQCQHARRRYELLRDESRKKWNAEWERYWIDVSKSDHISCWKLVATIEGRQSTKACPVSARVQNLSYHHLYGS